MRFVKPIEAVIKVMSCQMNVKLRPKFLRQAEIEPAPFPLWAISNLVLGEIGWVVNTNLFQKKIGWKAQ